ncbi:MAG: hypothetical protein DWH74_00120 [Planctomycetota bacterium]|nr:MAG: hypothetical protein DWH74_00120 [Planctomycetota bacterium]
MKNQKKLNKNNRLKNQRKNGMILQTSIENLQGRKRFYGKRFPQFFHPIKKNLIESRPQYQER